MQADRNKTELTLRVTEAAALWLTNLGAKCVETEVYVGEKWVADLAGLWSPTRTEAQAHKLIPRQRYDYRAPINDQVTANQSREAAYSALPPIITIACEVKTSIGDFRSDEKWYRAPPADLRLLAMPADMLPKDCWPSGWWVALYREGRQQVVIAKRAELTPVDDAQRFRIAANIAERQHNRQHYALSRDLARSHRDRENEDKSLLRFDRAASAVVEFIENGGDFEKFAMKCAMNKSRVPHYLKERLESLRARLSPTQPQDHPQ